MDKDNPSYIGLIYNQIEEGFSEKIVNKQCLYFRHPTMSEYFTIYSRYNNILKEAQLKGLLTEKEKIQEAIELGAWKEETEKEIYILKTGVKNLNKTRNKLQLPSQKAEIDRLIKTKEAILLTFTRERQSVINYTAEEYASNRFTDEMIFTYLYKNKDLKEKLFNNIYEYNDICDDDLNNIKIAYNTYSEDLTEYNIKLIAASGFFQNMIFIGDQSNSFWGKPVIKCSKYQNDLLVYGKIFRSVIKNKAETGEEIKEEILNDPKLFLHWLDDQNKTQSKAHGKNKGGSNMVTSFVGATAEDYKKMGITVEKFKGKSILDLAAEKGGVLEKNDYLKVRENS